MHIGSTIESSLVGLQQHAPVYEHPQNPPCRAGYGFAFAQLLANSALHLSRRRGPLQEKQPPGRIGHVRLRTTKTKGCLSRMTALTMVFKLCQSASKKWRRLDGSHQIADIIQGVKFKDGEKLTERAA